MNNLFKADSFPLPRMEECFDRVGSSRYVTKLDLLKGYWQVPLTQHTSEISAFVTPDAFMQYTVMAFGMRNAPATFQRLAEASLTLNLSQYEFARAVVTYLSKRVEQGQVKPVRAKVEAVAKFHPLINTRCTSRHCSGKAEYYRGF